MNTNPRATRILCYGDSNTWGKVPGTKHERYKVTERWTGLLQEKLGEKYDLIEEGLNSRTIDLDDPDPFRPGRNGLALLMPLLESQSPLDIIILMLGTNDLKTKYNRTPEQIAASMRQFLATIDEYAQKFETMRPSLLLMSPPLVKEVRPELYGGAYEKSLKLAPLYQEIAHSLERCLFINVAQHTSPSDIDGVHLEKEDHKRLAEAVYDVLTSKWLDKHSGNTIV